MPPTEQPNVTELKGTIARATSKAFSKQGFGARRAAVILGVSTQEAAALLKGDVSNFTLEEVRGFREKARGEIWAPGLPEKHAGTEVIPVAERFWSKVDRLGPDDCWPWIAARDDKGYGRIKHEGRM